MNTARYGHTAVLLANRQALVLDGVDESPGGTFPLWLNSNKGTKCEIGIKKSKAVLGRFESCSLRQ